MDWSWKHIILARPGNAAKARIESQRPPTAKGRRQADTLGKMLRNYAIDFAFTPLTDCTTLTAQRVIRNRPVPVLTLDLLHWQEEPRQMAVIWTHNPAVTMTLREYLTLDGGQSIMEFAKAAAADIKKTAESIGAEHILVMNHHPVTAFAMAAAFLGRRTPDLLDNALLGEGEAIVICPDGFFEFIR